MNKRKDTRPALFPDAGAAVKNGDIDSFQKERADMLAYHEPFMISYETCFVPFGTKQAARVRALPFP